MEVVDWGLARATGRRFSPGGPGMSADDARGAVADLRALARYAVDPVRERTGLDAGDAPEAVIVDRAAWVDSNVDGFRTVLAPLLEKMATHQSSAATAIGSRVTGLQMGAMLAFLSGKVLGQYEAFTPAGTGRLLLVAPNIVAAERQLDVEPRDFRLWVCLHEETHRVQFGAVPWLSQHLVGEIHDYLALSDVSAGEAIQRLRAGLGAVLSAVRGDENASLVDAVQTPEQQVVFDRITALMSLLEGHADFVMDDVGPGDRADRRRDPSALRQAPRRGGRGRRPRPPAARPRREDAAVLRGARLRRARRRPGGARRLQPGVERPVCAALPRRGARPRRLVRPDRPRPAGMSAQPAREVARAVRDALADLPPDALVLVACSGGPDSVALAVAARSVRVQVGAVVVDHGLQPGSDQVAETAAAWLREQGLAPVDVVAATVVAAGAGPEAAAREARYRALMHTASAYDAAAVLLGHTRDDQAETVLLGLARGSGLRSLAGMPRVRGIFRRPLLDLARDTVRAAVPDGAPVVDDPHNADARFARARVRHTVLPMLERELGPGVSEALARTADLARADADALAELADEVAHDVMSAAAEPHALDVEALAATSAALRSRVIRLWLVERGCPAGSLGAEHVARVSRLVTTWTGQGAVALPGGVDVARERGMLRVRPTPPR